MEKAKQARADNEAANELEQIKLAVINAMAEGSDGLVSKGNLKTALSGIIKGEVEDCEEGGWIVEGQSRTQYIITASGQVTAKNDIVIAAVSKVTEIIVPTGNKEITIEQGGTADLSKKIETTPQSNIEALTYSKKDGGSDNIIVNSSTGAVSVTSNAEITDTATIVIAGSISTSVKAEITIKVKKAEAMVGQFVEYNVGYIDISQNASSVANNFEFTPSNGWRILETGEEDTREGHSGEYIGAKIISTGVPGGLFYSTLKTNNSWWDSDESLDTKVRVANGLSTPSKFETIVFNKKTVTEANNNSYKNQGYYTQIKHYTSNPPTVINTDGKTAAELFKINNVAAEVDTLTLTELNKALNAANGNTARTIGTDNSNTDVNALSSTNDPRSLFYLRGLGSTYNYATDTKNCSYWLASPGPSTSEAYFVRDVTIAGYIGSSSLNRYGVRPVVSLSSNVYIKKVGNIWKIFSATTP